MRRILTILLCLLLLSVPVAAAAPAVALTFDDGPSGRFTTRLLDGLREQGVHATFFLCGYRIEQYPGLAGRIGDDGHEIGLHGFSHRDMAAMDPGELERELADTRALLPDKTEIRLMRPPGGKITDTVTRAAEDCGTSVITWSVDPRDWATDDAAAITKAVLERVRDGDIILLHDMSDSSVDAALAIVGLLKQRGYRFCTVSELAQRSGITLTPGEHYSRLPPT